MTKEQQQVREFMLAAGQECPNTLVTYPRQDLMVFRQNLIQEELNELSLAYYNIVGIADALGDLLYVVIGTAVTYGIDLEPIFQEIHRSNMTKFIDGHRREDGKWIKGPSYSPANLEPILEQQIRLK